MKVATCHHPAVLVRISLLVVATLVLAWVAVLFRDHELGEGAAQRTSRDPKAPAVVFARDMRRLENAELLNPDSKWDLYRSYFWLIRGEPQRAARLADDLVRREPANIRAWVQLSLALRARAPRRSREALASARHLDPLGELSAR